MVQQAPRHRGDERRLARALGRLGRLRARLAPASASSQREEHRGREQNGEQSGERGHLEAIVRLRGSVVLWPVH